MPKVTLLNSRKAITWLGVALIGVMPRSAHHFSKLQRRVRWPFSLAPAEPRAVGRGSFFRASRMVLMASLTGPARLGSDSPWAILALLMDRHVSSVLA